MQIDWGFVAQEEGGQRLDGYVPYILGQEGNSSGVTIGTGVDLGARSVFELKGWNLPEDLERRLLPYLGKKRQDAVDFLSRYPLYITKQEADILDQKVKDGYAYAVIRFYNRDSVGPSFEELPWQAQTVIISVAWQHGQNLAVETPKFWGYVTTQNWWNAYNELLHFTPKRQYQERREREAALLSQILR